MTHRFNDHPNLALASSLPLPDEAGVPDWVHLVPTALGDVTTHDGRGPYRIADAAAVIQASLANPRGMPIDENHATDLAGPAGGPAPARGWIKELDLRADGIWGRVEWSETGRALLAEKAYRGISPVLALNPDKKTIRALLRASLTNVPNLLGLSPVLNQETPMDFMAKLREALGLAADAGEDVILSACGKKKDDEPALQSAITDLGTAFGVSGDPLAIVNGVKGKATAQPAEVVALQAQLTAVTTQLNGLTEAGKRDKATAFVDGAIQKGHVGVKPSRDRFIAMHMSDPAGTEALIAGFPTLTPSGLSATPPAASDGTVALSAEQLAACTALGISVDDYKKSLSAEKERS